MLPDEHVVNELTRFVWSSLLGLDAHETSPVLGGTSDLSASVDISGEWEGTVSIALPMPLATLCASRMLSREESEMSPAEVRDVLAELVHVVGGNLKPALPGPSSVSMPRLGTTPSIPVPTATQARFWFQCDGQPFSVTVHERPCRSSES